MPNKEANKKVVCQRTSAARHYFVRTENGKRKVWFTNTKRSRIRTVGQREKGCGRGENQRARIFSHCCHRDPYRPLV